MALATLTSHAPDPLWGLAASYTLDSRPIKYDLIVGVYRDDDGAVPVMDAVYRAEQGLIDRREPKGYLGLSGNVRYNDLMTHLLLGDGDIVQRATTVQSVAGTGALRLLAELIARTGDGARVLLGTPSYVNHQPILEAAGLEVITYPYLDRDGRVDGEAMLVAIAESRPGDVLLLQGCCHNPTGTTISPRLWELITDACVASGVIPFIDQAYYGLGDGLNEDLSGMRRMLERVPEAFVAVSGSKAFSLYSERVGCAIVISDPEHSQKIRTSLETIARASYSQPPNHGAALVAEILGDDSLRRSWRLELSAMQERISTNRQTFVSELSRRVPHRDFSSIAEQRGMFLTLGLTPEEMIDLRRVHGVYGLPSGRINIAGVRTSAVPAVAAAVGAAIG